MLIVFLFLDVLVQWQLKSIHKFLMLFFLLLQQLVIFLPTTLPKLFLRLNKNLVLKSLKTLPHFLINFQTDPWNYFTKTVCLTQDHQFLFDIWNGKDNGFYFSEYFFRKVRVMQDFSNLIFRRWIKLINLYSSDNILESLSEVDQLRQEIIIFFNLNIVFH